MENPFVALDDLPVKELMPGFAAKFIHTEGLTVGYIHIKQGSVLHEHFHVNEQITSIISGELEMTVGGHTKLLKAGEMAVIPSNVPHGVVAKTDVYAIDVFRPTRTDYF